MRVNVQCSSPVRAFNSGERPSSYGPSLADIRQVEVQKDVMAPPPPAAEENEGDEEEGEAA